MEHPYARLFQLAQSSYEYTASPLVESIYYNSGCLPLWDFHFARLQVGFLQNKWDGQLLDADYLLTQIRAVAANSSFTKLKIRLQINVVLLGSQSKLMLEIRTEDWSSSTLFQQPFSLDFYTTTFDFDFSNSKSVAALNAYQDAKLFAQNNALQDVIVCNSKTEILDATLANVFLIKDACIFTNSLYTGAVAGVMRAYLLDKKGLGFFEIKERPILQQQDILEADAVFLTNAVRGIIPVVRVGEKIKALASVESLQRELEQLIFTSK